MPRNFRLLRNTRQHQECRQTSILAELNIGVQAVTDHESSFGVEIVPRNIGRLEREEKEETEEQEKRIVQSQKSEKSEP